MARVVVLAVLFSLGTFAARSGCAALEIDADLATALGFERGGAPGHPVPWGGGPKETICTDTVEFHGGKASARIERTAESSGDFSSLTLSVPMSFGGARVELRGYVRTQDVSGFAGLWMRQDGDSPGLAFDNMQRRQLRGTTAWTEYSITLPVHRDGKTLYFGFLVSGSGTAWVDDMRLLVDGKPIWEAPKAARVETVLDRDHAFDTGSGISLTDLKPHQIQNLATLCRVWGFLKYHHPVVMQGQRHWDYDLFRVMPGILAATNPGEAHVVLEAWVRGLGASDEGGRPALDGKAVHLRPDLAWLGDVDALGADLSKALRAIHAKGSSSEEQFFVALIPGVKNPSFTNEPAYKTITGVDAGYQLLALFRFWNIIHTWFPYRDLITDWDEVLVEFIPRVGLAASRDDYALEMMAMIARVGDTHVNLWSSLDVRPPRGDSLVPASVRPVGGRFVVDRLNTGQPQAASALQRGDVIMSIDGEPVDVLVARWAPYFGASNDAARIRDIARTLLRGASGPVRLAVRRGAEELEVDVTRVSTKQLVPDRGYHDLPGPAFRRLSKDVAYLKFSEVKAADAASYVEQAAGTQGWVLDLRNYPSEFLVFALGNHLVDRPVEFARFSRAELGNPGAFLFDNTASLKPERPRYAGRIVVLVDEVSQSSSEYHAMAFRAVPGAIVVGSTTAGADGNASQIPLPGGLRTMISGIGVFYPDKRPTQRVGIVPDIEARPTIDGIRDGRDEVLEVALRQILGPGVSEDEIRRLASVRE